MICSTCPRPTDGESAQCDRCLLRHAQQLHQPSKRPPVLLTESQQEKGIIDQVTRAVLSAKERRDERQKKPRKLGAPRKHNGRLEVGESEGGWVVVAVLLDGLYRVRCPLCPTETNKNRTQMGRTGACRSCANKQGKRGSVTR